jgi:hypothetical protein
MELPSIPHVIRDPDRKVEYVVLAYRNLTREEVLQAIRAFNRGKRAAPKDSRITITTTIGANE